MNFKLALISMFFFLILAAGCGVKSDPVPPPGTQLPNYVDKFLEEEPDKERKDDKERP